MHHTDALIFQRGSVVKCLTCNQGDLGSRRTEPSGFFFVGVSLGKTIPEKPHPSSDET